MKNQGLSIRLQKFIADCGVASRRKAELLILDGRVKLNGAIVSTLGTKVNPHIDAVEVDGQVIDPAAVDKLYILLHKPRGYVTTVNDPEGRKTVLDLCRGIKARIFPVGRLDYLSEGLLLLTNDGDVANLVMHPKYEVTKVYEVKVFGRVNEQMLKDLRKGAELADGFLRPLSVRVIEELPQKTWLEFRLKEGKNREIRRLCEAQGMTVDKLKRVAIGTLSIHGIAPGNYQLITKKALLSSLGMDEKGKKIKDVEFISAKKSVRPRRLARRIPQSAKWADSEEYHKYRKGIYYETLKRQKEVAEHLKTQRSTPQE